MENRENRNNVEWLRGMFPVRHCGSAGGSPIKKLQKKPPDFPRQLINSELVAERFGGPRSR